MRASSFGGAFVFGFFEKGKDRKLRKAPTGLLSIKYFINKQMEGIKTFKMTQKDLDKILSQREGHFLDFKSKAVRPAKLTQSISAFANAEGGELYVGFAELDNEFSWDGFNNPESANGHLQIFEEIFPLGHGFRYSFLEHPSNTSLSLKIEINKSKEIKKASNGKIYLRRSAQNLPQNTDEKLERLKKNKGITSFEDEVVPTKLERITDSLAIFEFMVEVIPMSEPEDWLKKQELIHDGKPLVVSVVVYDDEPQVPLAKRCGLKIYRYATSDKEGTRNTLQGVPETIDGNIYNQIFDAVDRVIEIIEDVRMMTAEGLIKVSYPKEALHEIITNALLHRDYSIPDDVHIRIFDNRVEVINPGTLAGHVTTKNILKTRFPRNPKIVRYVNKYPNPPNQDVGEGLVTAFQRMREMKLKEPEIFQEDGRVKVILRHEPLASPEELILEYLAVHEQIANKDARQLTFIGSENKMKRIIQRMVAKDILERVPGTTRYTATYRLKIKD